MTIDPKAAAAALDEIDQVGRMVRQSNFYRRASLIMVLWGVLVVFGNLAGFAMPHLAGPIWLAVNLVGMAGTIALAACGRGGEDPAKGFEWRIPAAFALFFAFGLLWTQGFAHFAPRQMGAFWPTYFMLAYALAGLWAGRALTVIGLGVTALTVLAYAYAGDWFEPWMALVNGGGLVLGGLWMRRA